MFYMRKQYILLVVFLIITLSILLTTNSSITSSLSGFVQNVFSSPKAAIYNAKVKTSPGENSEIERLKNENTALLKNFIDYEKMKRDNEALRNQFETGETQTYSLMPAQIIGFLGSHSSPRALVINLGKNNGIATGQAVIYKNNLVGKIDRVSNSYSRIQLVQNDKFSTIGMAAENGSTGVVKGQNDFILLDNIAVSDKIVKGETIISKGDINDQGIGIPGGLVIGRISGVSRQESMPFQTAKVKSSINVASLTTVFVVLGFK